MPFQLPLRFKDLTGKRFGRLVAIRPAARDINKRLRWLCECDCGNETICLSNALQTGDSTSCGCLREELRSIRNLTHGQGGKTPAYHSWCGMIQRCTNPNSKAFPNYGGRGITVCERWRKFENFYADMGAKPEGLSLDRINNDGNYEATNCRWATRSQQAQNRRGVYSPEIRAKILAIVETEGITYKTAARRVLRDTSR
jgi:hypothetical protein